MRTYFTRPSKDLTTEVLLAEAAGVNFDLDFHAQSIGLLCADLAKVNHYRKPAQASGSTGRYYFYHLRRFAWVWMNPYRNAAIARNQAIDAQGGVDKKTWRELRHW